MEELDVKNNLMMRKMESVEDSLSLLTDHIMKG